MDLKAKLSELGAELPKVADAVADYVPAVRFGRLVYVSGQVPMVDGKVTATGRVEPGNDALQAAQDAARQCVLNGLAAADAVLDGDWSAFERVVKVVVYVAGADGFDGPHHVANGASQLLAEVFGEAGRHARVAVSVKSLPLDVPVEVEMTLGLSADAD